MGDYVYVQGKAKIDPTYVKHLQAFFNSRHDDPDYELNWPKLLESEPTLRLYHGYKILASQYGKGSERIPFSMPNPTGWPDSFDELPKIEGDQYGTGELELDDEGNLTFKCSSRNRNAVVEAFISLIFMWSRDYEIKYDTSEWALMVLDRGDFIKTFVPGDEAGFDHIMDKVGETWIEMERKAELWKLAPLTEEEKQKALDMGISKTFLEGLDGPCQDLVDVPSQVDQVEAWSKLVYDKLATMGIPKELFTASTPRGTETFPEYIVRLGMTRLHKPDDRVQSLNSTKLGQFDSQLERIKALKLFARGKKGVRQVKRKQRRAMKA